MIFHPSWCPRHMLFGYTLCASTLKDLLTDPVGEISTM